MAFDGRGGVVGLLGMALALLAACTGGDNGAASTPTPSPTATSTATAAATAVPTASASPRASLEDEVAEAYLAYWDAYSQALLELDVTLVAGHAAGEELERIREEIETLRADGVALRVVVEHDFAVSEAPGGNALVIDKFLDRSFYVDPETKEPPTAEIAGEELTDSFELERTGDGWVVIRSRRLG